MKLKLQKHHVAEILRSLESAQFGASGTRTLLDGGPIQVDLAFLIRFANCAREAELWERGHTPTPKAESMSLPAMEALQTIRFSGGNEDPTSVWMQKWAAWGMEPNKWPKPPEVPLQHVADSEREKSFVAYTDKTARQAIDEYLHPRVPADLQPVGRFVYEGMAYVATSSDDPRGVKLYGSPSEAQAVREAHRKNRPDPCTACGGAALMGGSECPVCDGTGRSFR
jgi:hypothetical protein